MSADETAQPSPTFELIVDELRTEADEVVVLALVDESGGELPPWAAGAHIDLHLPIGLTR